MTDDLSRFQSALRARSSEYAVALDDSSIDRLGRYYDLLQRWNPRLHLVAPCPPEEFATRHVLESLVALRFIRPGDRIIDIGSGGGLPIFPLLIAGQDLTATLIEASTKKSVFLREVVSSLGLDATVVNDRFQNGPAPDADRVTCRALEQFADTVAELVAWAPAGATLLLFGGDAIQAELKKLGRRIETVPLAGAESRRLFVVEPA